jgi:hypothetical protein
MAAIVPPSSESAPMSQGGKTRKNKRKNKRKN